MSCPHPCHSMACSCPPVLGWGTLHDRERDYVTMVTQTQWGETATTDPHTRWCSEASPAPVAAMVGSTEVGDMLKEKMRDGDSVEIARWVKPSPRGGVCVWRRLDPRNS